MTNTASSTSRAPTHHVTITDGTNTVPIVLCDEKGSTDKKAIRSLSYPREAMKTFTGDSEYSSLEPPFMSIAQSDFQGGRGNEIFEKDRSRYFTSYKIDTSRNGRIMLGGLETYATGYRNSDLVMPGSVTFTTLSGTSKYLGRSFVASATYPPMNIEIWVKRTGTPTGTLTAKLYTNSGGSPGSAIANAVQTVTTSTIDDVISVLYKFTFVTSPGNITSGTTYHVVIYDAGTPDASNYWSAGCDTDAATNTKKSSDGTSWSAASNALYFRVTDVDDDFIAHFIEHEGQLYFGKEPFANSAGALYINGDLGACDSNTGALSTLVDASKSWTVNEWANCIAQIRSPYWSSSSEYTLWRKILSNTSTALTVSPSWNAIHTTATDYAIVGSNKFTAVTTAIDRKVTDVISVNNTLYIFQDTSAAEYFWTRNANGTWTNSYGDAKSLANKAIPIYDPVSGYVIWLIRESYYNTSRPIITRVPTENKYEGGQLDGMVQITPCDSTHYWNEQVVGECTSSWDTNRVKIAVGADFTTGIIASQSLSSFDLRYYDRIMLAIMVDQDLQAGDLQLILDDTANCTSATVSIDLPNLQANNLRRIIVDYDALQVSGANAIISVGLNMAVDRGAVNIYLYPLWDGIVAYVNTIVNLPSTQRITGLEAYGDPDKLWVFTEGGIGYVDNDLYIPLKLKEFASAKSEYNGAASCVNDVYLYFSFGEAGAIMRYYEPTLDSIGLDQDAGLPDNERGPVSYLTSYPGRVFAAIDGGTDNYSGIYMFRNGGWHQVYRSPRVGARIRSMYCQTIPGTSVDKLWFGMGSDVLSVPLSMNPKYDDDYYFTHEGNIETSWIHYGYRDVNKSFHRLKVFGDNLGSNYYIEADYKTDSDTSWTAISGNFNTTPSELLTIATVTPNAKRIKFRLRFYTKDKTTSPELESYVVEGLCFVGTKKAIGFNFKIAEGFQNINIRGVRDTTYSTVQAIIAQLDSWANNGTVLTFSSNYSPLDNLTGFIEPLSFQPASLVQSRQTEKHIGTLLFVEV